VASGDRAIWRDLMTTTRTVLLRPSRFARLVRLGPAGWAHMARFLGSVVPKASRRLGALRERAVRIPDPRLRAEALASIDLKAYHAQGGSILATFLRGERADRFVSIVVPLETIYDYLDNLCDRLGNVPPMAFATLHEALTDALDPDAPARDYYRDGPALDDGGYLRGLVEDVRAGVRQLPHYRSVASRTREAAVFYSELQALKHLPPSEREARCERWYADNRERFPDLYWWEFAAACGSSLPVFAMLFLASEPELAAADVAATFDAYFPSVSAVHILLDYFIDQAEDREHLELNFVACYATLGEAVERVRALVGQAAWRLRTIAHADGHSFLLNAMCLFYLTHPKVFAQRLDSESAALLGALG
jgi:tetraprenyl-beta-curcumene synthase